MLVGDVNGDGDVNMADAAFLEQCITTPSLYYGGVDYVDLGLPSGLLWASANVGATSPEGYGEHYAWGELATKDNYAWATYKWGTSATTLTKYCTSSSSGTVDNLSTLQPVDDVAHTSTDCGWHIPSIDDWLELEKYCTMSSGFSKGTSGYYVISKQNWDRIFLPYSGYSSVDYIYDEDYDACYWANDLYALNTATAYGYYIGSSNHFWAYRPRYLGNPVRPVIYSYETVCDLDGDGLVTNADLHALIKRLWIPGDADDDGSVTLSDLSAISKHILGTEVVSTFNKYNADVNMDGLVNIVDLSVVTKIMLDKTR